MKTKSISMACLTAIIAVPASHAFQPPVDDAPPPPPIDAPEAPAAPREMPPAKPGQRGLAAEDAGPAAGQAGFLGINVSEIPEMLGAHIDLPAGQGVLVRVVAPGSAADVAGMRVHDVILKVAGKPVASHHDVSQAVAAHEAGDAIKIEILRQGEARQVEAVLDARPAERMADPRFGRQHDPRGLDLEEMFFEGLPQDQAGRIRDMIERNLRALGEPGGLMDDEVFQDAFRGMREQMQQLLEDPKPFAPLDENEWGFGNIQMNAGATVRLMDDKGSVEIKTIDGSKEVLVRDLDNEVIWNGPWDTEQDKAAAPDDVRERIERLNIQGFQDGQGLRLQFFQDR